ncbi:MAG: glycosyltransferase [Deltaproteobacteria bacterium]|nr:glycosyltransferase [Deltaproteobacteria bacterium]MDQ3296064.1 glycosyltransferase [Myxococcota bacterium]
MARPRISIVTPSYNQAQFIGRTIDSVLSQRGDFDLEYKIFDGGSKDDTVAVLKSYGDRIEWISERDSGQIDAINKGLRAVTGDIVGWVNSDDVLMPGALQRVARAFADHPQVEWVHGRCVIIDEHDREIRKLVSLYKHFRCKNHTFENLLTENYVSQMTAFWRRSVHDEIGYLDPTHDLAFDYDLFLKLAHRGDPIYLDDPVACFRMYDTSKSGAGYVAQVEQANTIASQYTQPSSWTRARMRAKKAAIVNVYRAMGLAKTALQRISP